MPVRHECPICGVEVMRGRTCNYHKRYEDRAKTAVQEMRVKHLTQIVNEAIDEARKPDRRRKR